MSLRLPSRFVGALLLVFALAAGWGFAQEHPLAVTLESYLVTTVTLEDGTVEERFTPAETAQPGQVLEYRLKVVNVSDEVLPANTVIISAPIPATTTYLADSATPGSASVLREFSIDNGASYAERPTVVITNERGEQVERPAPPESYTNVRWILKTPLEPQATLHFSYRVTVR